MKRKLISLGLLLSLLLAFLSLPTGISLAGSSAQTAVEEALLNKYEAEAYPISMVHVDGQTVRLTYQQSALQDQTTMPFAYLDVLMIAAEYVPAADSVSLEVDYFGEPFFELSANSSELQALMNDAISAEQFLSEIHFRERRSLETMLLNEFSARGYPYGGFQLDDSNLYIPVTAATLQPEQMVETTIELASMAVNCQTDLNQITLAFTGSKGRQVQFRLPAQQAASYAAGEQSMLETMASVELVEPTARRQRSPLLGRFLGVVELALAAMAAAFYSVSAVRLRSWSLAIKAGALVVLPALIAGLVMLLLML